jgi:hypothetical protein
MRLRFFSRRGNTAFFERLRQSFADSWTGCRVETNAATGSLLLISEALDPQRLSRFGSDHDLFSVEETLPPGESLAVGVGRPLQKASRKIGQISGGTLDLPGLLFVALLLFGIFELIRGNYKSPPWYTAFWYAFGLFSRSVFDRQIE